MSHFLLTVITKKGQSIDDLLAPFEEKEVPKYVKYTKEQAIEHERQKLLKYKESWQYKEYLKDPEKYLAECENKGHAEYISVEFPKKLEFSDEQLYEEAIKYEEKDELGPNGEIYSTWNAKSKWDYYTDGGRWQGCLARYQKNPVIETSEEGIMYVVDDYEFTNTAKVSEIDFNRLPSKSEYIELKEKWGAVHKREQQAEYYDKTYGDLVGYVNDCIKFSTYAALTPDGEWHEPGQMGWFGMSSATDEDEEKFKAALYEKCIEPYINGDYYINMVDCHI